MPGKNNELIESSESKESAQSNAAADRLRHDDFGAKISRAINDFIHPKDIKVSRHLTVDHFDKDAFRKFLSELPKPEHKVGAYIERIREPRLPYDRKFADLADKIGQHYAKNAGMVASEKKEIGKRFSEFSKERAGMPYSQSELVRDFIPLEKSRYQFDHDKNMFNISKKADQQDSPIDGKRDIQNGRKAQNEYRSIRKLALAQFVTEKLPGKDLRADSEAHKEFLSLFEKD